MSLFILYALCPLFGGLIAWCHYLLGAAVEVDAVEPTFRRYVIINDKGYPASWDEVSA